EIVVDKEEVKIDLSERRTEKIEIKVEPEDASNKEITVESSNGNVAAIDGEGKITARANGETELTIKTSNGIEKKVKVVVETSETGIKLDKNYVQLDLSNNKQSMIKATVEPSTASNKEITYMSSNEEIATVDKEGKITANGNGEANIIARTSNGKEAVCKVEVKTEATEIEMEEEVKIDLSKEKEKKITVDVKPNNAKTKAVMIRSNNEEVATIDANGTIKAKKNGTAIITAEVVGTDISKTCKVIVTTSPTGLKLNKTSVNLDLSGTKTTKLTTEVEPATASNKQIEWSSSNSNVITVDNAGNVIAKKNGTANIIAKIKETNISKTCKVIVATSPTGIKLSKTSVSLDMSGTKIVQLTATVLPDTASNKTVTWSSSNTSIVSVDKNGKVTAKKNGTATITVKTVNGKVKKCTTKVTTSPTGINLNKTSITIDNGKSTTLTATVLPSTASNKTVSWSSSNTGIATVDKNGKITGKKEGTTTITVKTNNGKKASCKITVKQEEIVASSKQIPVTQSYINHLKQKVIYYDYKEDSFMKSGNHTNYVCMVDVGQCRLTIFKKINGNWEVAKIDNNRSCIWNTYQGVRNSTTRAEMSGWRGPRSASFKTATRIIDKHPTADGNKWISCFVGPNPKYNLADPRYGYTHVAATVQRFEYAPRLKDPNNVPLSQRYYSMGCTVVNEEAAYYVYKNIPSDSTVVIFDENNPLPLWYAWDNASSGCSYTPRKDVPYSISLSPTSTELKVGQTKNVKITINPGNASHRGITYNSSNNKVATVDKNGKITAKSKGTTTITARVLGLTAKCKVEVK
ncbi:MAG: Ig-like domain-containing protein, partial [Clostridia bacterium]|nr:Ig-like domain-containing protein [Clostridia bacterium]